jgi:hypothetical protein
MAAYVNAMDLWIMLARHISQRARAKTQRTHSCWTYQRLRGPGVYLQSTCELSATRTGNWETYLDVLRASKRIQTSRGVVPGTFRVRIACLQLSRSPEQVTLAAYREP